MPALPHEFATFLVLTRRLARAGLSRGRQVWRCGTRFTPKRRLAYHRLLEADEIASGYGVDGGAAFTWVTWPVHRAVYAGAGTSNH